MIIEQLNEAMEAFRNEFRSINSGGCCVMATLIAERLIDVVPDVEIKVYTWSEHDDVDALREEIIDPMNKFEWNEAGVSFTHVWVEFVLDGTRYAIDSDHGVLEVAAFHSREGRPMAGAFTLDEARSFAMDGQGWNSCFDRDQIPAMQRLADELMDFNTEEVMYG